MFVAVPVFVGVIGVGVSVAVAVADPVGVAVLVEVGVLVMVGVRVMVGVSEAGGMGVELGSHPCGAEVMMIGTLTRMVRALNDSITNGSNGTIGTMGAYSVWTRTRMRLTFPIDGMKVPSVAVPAGQ